MSPATSNDAGALKIWTATGPPVVPLSPLKGGERVHRLTCCETSAGFHFKLLKGSSLLHISREFLQRPEVLVSKICRLPDCLSRTTLRQADTDSLVCTAKNHFIRNLYLSAHVG